MFNNELSRNAAALLENCRKKGATLATAESCTGGMLATLLTEIPGASSVFIAGYIPYSNEAKTAQLGVDADLIGQQGAVSDQTAAALAQGARVKSRADVAVAITGIAGPSGGSKDKPVGLVYIAVATKENIVVENNHFTGDRNSIRQQSVAKALSMLEDMVARSFSYTA